MKPFNLEKALAGEPVVTRDGCTVHQLHLFDADNTDYRLIGVIDGSIHSWNIDGKYWKNEEGVKDLFMKSKIVVKWVNVWTHSGVSIYDSEEAANRYVPNDPNTRLGNKAHRIEWEE